MENNFNFGDIVYHTRFGKGVYLGESKLIYPSIPSLADGDKVEVILNNCGTSTTVSLDDLCSEEPQIKFVDSARSTFEFRNLQVGQLDVYENGDKVFELLDEDIDKFINCLRQFKDTYVND